VDRIEEVEEGIVQIALVGCDFTGREKFGLDSHSWLSSDSTATKPHRPECLCYQNLVRIDFFRGQFSLNV
jgi:hypothetical protein